MKARRFTKGSFAPDITVVSPCLRKGIDHQALSLVDTAHTIRALAHCRTSQSSVLCSDWLKHVKTTPEKIFGMGDK